MISSSKVKTYFTEDHFKGGRSIPDWANDKHTIAGKKLGRGLDHFRSEDAKLVPPATKDQYEDEAYRLWELQAQSKQQKRDLFDDRR